MRTRSRTSTVSYDKGIDFASETKWTYRPYLNSSSNNIVQPGMGSYQSGESTIIDSVAPFLSKRKKASPRYMDSVQVDLNNNVKGTTRTKISKPCNHTKTSTSYKENVSVKTREIINSGPPFERIVNASYGHRSALSVGYHTIMPADPFGEATNGEGAAYRTPDWFSLSDAFKELSEQYIPNQMLLGETIAEGGIYMDAIKAIISPSSAIKSLIKNLSGTKFRKRHLGEISNASKAAGKDLASNYLGYHFAVKPAIDDIRAVLNAHRTVTKRLAWMSNNGGKFVPLRVRQKMPVDVANLVLPSTSQCSVFTHLAEKESQGVISAYAQLRESPLGDAAWQAYYQYFGLNKILGLAWELVPFSFVVDWVTNAQEAVNSFTRLSTGSPYLGLVGISASEKYTKKYELRFKGGTKISGGAPVVYPADSESIVLGERTITQYTRSTSIPTGEQGVVDFSTLGTFHGSIGGALLLQLGSKRIR